MPLGAITWRDHDIGTWDHHLDAHPIGVSVVVVMVRRFERHPKCNDRVVVTEQLRRSALDVVANGVGRREPAEGELDVHGRHVLRSSCRGSSGPRLVLAGRARRCILGRGRDPGLLAAGGIASPQDSPVSEQLGPHLAPCAASSRRTSARSKEGRSGLSRSTASKDSASLRVAASANADIRTTGIVECASRSPRRIARPGDHGHPHIGNQEVDGSSRFIAPVLVPDPNEQVSAVRHLGHVVPVPTQGVGNESAHVWVILGNDDPRRHVGSTNHRRHARDARGRSFVKHGPAPSRLTPSRSLCNEVHSACQRPGPGRSSAWGRVSLPARCQGDRRASR